MSKPSVSFWAGCPEIESVPGKLSGAPVIVRSRVRPEDLLTNRFQGVDWLAENYGLPLAVVSAVLRFHDQNALLVSHPV